jgi:hypothetical protein
MVCPWSEILSRKARIHLLTHLGLGCLICGLWSFLSAGA